MDVYRCVDGSERKPVEMGLPIKTDAKVCADLGVMTPRSRVVYSRLRLFLLILSKANVRVLATLYAGRKCAKSWLRCVEADFTWVSEISRHLAELRGASIGEWITLCVKNQAKALEPIKAAILTHEAAEVAAAATGPTGEPKGATDG